MVADDWRIMSRPETLSPLFATLESLDGVGAKTAQLFGNLDISRVKDMLFHLPVSIIHRRLCESVHGANPPEFVTVVVHIVEHLPQRGKGRPYRIVVKDNVQQWSLVFFKAYEKQLQNLFPIGKKVVVSGRIELFDGSLQMAHPDYVLPVPKSSVIPQYEPIYATTAGLGQKIWQKSINGALLRACQLAPTLGEWIDPALIIRKKWPSWYEALHLVHHPKNESVVYHESPAFQRLCYDELFAHQLTLALARSRRRCQQGVVTKGGGHLRSKLLAQLPFVPTKAQLRTSNEIIYDMAAPMRMNRLLQGDVGSGKTLVALIALLNAVEVSGQGALMVPTEILAHQHYYHLQEMAKGLGVNIVLLTGRDKGSERMKKLADLADGSIDILVGTHALFQSDVCFYDLRLAIIDEQHRFGVSQRMMLGAKGARPELGIDTLVMTATPIPRSLTLAIHGDSDISILDEKPPGRKAIKTAMISLSRLDEVVNHLKEAIKKGRQAYWVCPLVEQSELVHYTSAEERYNYLCAALGEHCVGLVHGQMNGNQKDQAVADFVAGKTQILVATTVIEVGVNILNATIIVIEQAEAFGLAQLHQLRGRVGRGSEQATCLLLYRAPLSQTASRRLHIIRESEDGFRIAEEDLAIRGAGDLIGTAQSGAPRFRMADLEKQTNLMALAQSDARHFLETDPDLSSRRGRAIRALLWLLDQDRAIRMIGIS